MVPSPWLVSTIWQKHKKIQTMGRLHVSTQSACSSGVQGEASGVSLSSPVIFNQGLALGSRDQSLGDRDTDRQVLMVLRCFQLYIPLSQSSCLSGWCWGAHHVRLPLSGSSPTPCPCSLFRLSLLQSMTGGLPGATCIWSLDTCSLLVALSLRVTSPLPQNSH